MSDRSALAVSENGTAALRNITPPEKRAASPAFNLMPTSVEQAMDLSKMLSDTGSEMIPAAYRGKPGSILAVVLMGAEIGLPPLTALSSIAMINGRPSLYGDGMIGLVRSHPVCEWIKEEASGTGDDYGWTVTAKRRGDPTIIENRFTKADAVRAKLWGKSGPWTEYGPNRMLKMRARSWTLRDGFADVLKGLAMREELEDTPVDDATRAAVLNAPTRTEAVKIALAARSPKAVTPAQDPTPAKIAAMPDAERCGVDFDKMRGAEIRDFINGEAAANNVGVEELARIEKGTARERLHRENAYEILAAIRALGEEGRSIDDAAAVAIADDEIPGDDVPAAVMESLEERIARAASDAGLSLQRVAILQRAYAPDGLTDSNIDTVLAAIGKEGAQ